VTGFAARLRERIALEGPLTVERYMALCLQHYYATRDPLGAAGDFTTAPEISQMFGELIGLWTTQVWEGMGRPATLRLVELGPGRGTLMADAMRAVALVPDFAAAASIHLVETSPALREKQKATLAAATGKVSWHGTPDDIPDGPAIVIANEFFDALPIRQFMATDRGWCERLVGIAGDAFAFGLSADAEPGLAPPGRAGEILERACAGLALLDRLGRRLAAQGGAALIIDYGYVGPRFCDTFQAVQRHAFADPLAEPGDADLTAHVDFFQLARSGEAAGLRVFGPSAQGEFLSALGIAIRASSLKRKASAGQAEDIDRAVERLTGRGPAAMGELFKVLGLSHPSILSLPGLHPCAARPPTRS